MRKTKEVTIPNDFPGERDRGKTFHLTEMSADQAEKWAARAWLALAQSGIDVPKEAIGGGWVVLAMLSLRAFAGAKFSDIEPLMDEMFACIKFKSSAGIVRPLLVQEGPDAESDIEEVPTRAFLRGEVFNLHAGFFLDGIKSVLSLVPKNMGGSSTAPTSQDQSQP